MGYLESCYRYENQFANQWDLFIDDNPNIRFRIQDSNIPFYQLVTETLKTGKKIYKELKEVEEVTFTVRESPSFNIFDYFNDWFSKFYDLENRVFKKQLTEYVNHKDITLKFYKTPFLDLKVPGLSTVQGTLDALTGKQDEFVTLLDSAFVINLKNCKIIGLDTLSMSYEAGPLLYNITVIPEEITYTNNARDLNYQ